jgi:hypothetical protein
MDLNTEVASGFTVAQYRALREHLDIDNPDTEEWRQVLEAFHRRINERFLRPIEELTRYDDLVIADRPMRSGFAILALDCLLIDTIQSFREGRIGTGGNRSARSFKAFLRAKAFADFSSRDREEFYNYVRNALLHNGETRHDWKIQIGLPRLLTKDPETGARTINRRKFHAAVLGEYSDFREMISDLESAEARMCFLRRMDAICDWPTAPGGLLYFAYGSNLLDAEILRTAQIAVPIGKAYVLGQRLAFEKHSKTREGDAATLVSDAVSVVWGFVYQLDGKDMELLRARDGGYREIELDAVLLPDDDTPTYSKVASFVAKEICEDRCGPSQSYLDLVIRGAEQRRLPSDYVGWLKRISPDASRNR